MLTHRHPGLSCTYNERISCFFNYLLLAFLPGDLIQVGHLMPLFILFWVSSIMVI
jgi:hypothetical protein